MENRNNALNAVRKLKRDGDYRMWAAQFEASMVTMNCERWLTDEPDAEEPAEVREDVNVKSRMLLTVDDRGLMRIIKRAPNSVQAWQRVRAEFEAELQLRQPLLVNQLNAMRQMAGESYTRFAERVLEVLEKLEDTSFEAADELAANALVRGLRESSEKGSLVLLLTPHVETGFNRVMTELKSATRLLESAREQTAPKDKEGRAMQSEGEKPKKDTRKCFNCGKQGHIARNCRLPKKEKPGAAMMAQGDACSMATGVPSVRGSRRMLYDSGTSHHVVHDLSVIRNARPSNTKRMVLGGGEAHDVLCEGEVWLRGGPLKVVELRSVLCVPSMKVNLLSGHLATEAGHECRQSGDRCHIIDDKGYLVLEGRKEERLYTLDCELMPAAAPMEAAAHVAVSAETWHRRLGHPGRDAMKKLAGAEGLEGCADEHNPTCDVCMKAKQTRDPFPRSESRATEACELLHTDLMGPFQVPSWGGAVYAVTLMDDMSRMAEVSCVVKKSDVYEWVKDTIRRWQRQTGRNVKAVRSDNGTEFKGRLRLFFRKEGINNQTSADYTPEQNGRAERLNRTLLEKTRAMLIEFDLSPKFWAAALEIASVVRNCMPTKGETVSPYEQFYGTAPDVQRLRVFGCLAYVHVPHAKRKKLDARAEAGILAGYQHGSKAYKVYVWRNGEFELVKSRNVRFDESHTCWQGCGLRRADEDYGFLETMISECDDHDDGVEEGYLPAEADDINVGDAYADMPALVPASDYGDSDEEPPELESEEEGDDDEDGGPDPPGSDDDATDENPEDPADDEAEEEHPAHRYPRRNRQPPDVYQPHAYNYAAAAELTDEPKTTKEVLSRPDAPLWEEAIDSEWASLKEKEVMEAVTEVPKGKRVLPMKPVYKVKRDALGAVDKYKARLVVLGCLQRKGMDYDEVFAPTAQQATFRILLAEAAECDLDLHQFDVATAYLHGELGGDEVYVSVPPEFGGGGVYRLRKALYGLKQAARAWHAKLLGELVRMGFTASEADPCLFFKGEGQERLYVLIYVDDGVIVGKRHAVQAALAAIAGAFDIKDIGEVSYFLGLQLQRDRQQGTIWLGQPKYARDTLDRFGMTACKPVCSPMEANARLNRSEESAVIDAPYAEAVGSLLYLTVNTRPDLAFAVGVLSRFVSKPSEVHWKAAKRVLRYLAGTLDRGIVYQRGSPDIEAYSDADYAGCTDTRRSTSGAVILKRGGAVVWRAKLQTVVAASTCEAEYIAAAAAAKELLWVRKLMGEMSGQVERVRLYGDNQSALALMQQHTPGASGRSKHIDVAYNFVRHRVMQGDIEPVFVGTKDMKADILTKALPGPSHEDGAERMGMKKMLKPLA